MIRRNLFEGANREAADLVLSCVAPLIPRRKRRGKMIRRNLFALFAASLLGTSSASAGNIYKITSRDGEKTITYEVRFGGGRLMDQFTAFDPEAKKFVYLQWNRNGKPPTPAMKLWDHRTGETVPLYNFPDARHPLPVIPSLESMKACPLTNDKDFKAKLHIIVD